MASLYLYDSFAFAQERECAKVRRCGTTSYKVRLRPSGPGQPGHKGFRVGASIRARDMWKSCAACRPPPLLLTPHPRPLGSPCLPAALGSDAAPSAWPCLLALRPTFWPAAATPCGRPCLAAAGLNPQTLKVPARRLRREEAIPGRGATIGRHRTVIASTPRAGRGGEACTEACCVGARGTGRAGVAWLKWSGGVMGCGRGEGVHPSECRRETSDASGLRGIPVGGEA
jgi:hypothetical protein